MFDVRSEDAAAVKMWALHLGIYNLLLATTICAGAVALIFHSSVIAYTLIVAANSFMIVAAITLIVADRNLTPLPASLHKHVRRSWRR